MWCFIRFADGKVSVRKIAGIHHNFRRVEYIANTFEGPLPNCKRIPLNTLRGEYCFSTVEYVELET